MISPLDNLVEIYENKHLYKPEEIAKAEAQAATAHYFQEVISLPAYKGRPEFEEKLNLVIALTEAMRSAEKASWEKCYPGVKR